MKKLCSLILIVVLILQLQTVSFAVSGLSDMSVDYSPVDASVNVSGEISSAKKGMLLTLQILSNDVPVGVAQTISNDDGSFAFESVLLSNSLPTGTLVASVSSSEIAETRASFEYNSITDMFVILKQISDASKLQNFAEVMSVISTSGTKLGVDYSLYSALDANAKSVFENVFYTKAYNLNAYDSYADDAEAIKAFRDNLTLLSGNYDEAIMLAKFAVIKTKADYDAWVAKYENVFEATKTTEQYTYYNKAVTYSELASHIADNGKVCITTQDAVNKIYECSVLTLIEVKQHAVVKELFTKFPQMLNINSAEFNKLTATQKASIYPKLAGCSFKTAQEAVDKFNEYVYAITGAAGGSVGNRPAGGGGGGGGGSASSGGSWGTGTSSQTVTVDLQEQPASVFKDIDSKHWAYKAVKYLYDKDIVNGSGDKNFNPGSNVTRAEFIKMLVSSLDNVKLTNPDGVVFSDIDNSMWYAIYVSAAKEKGITTGDTNGNFNPNGRITRQDIAVMLVRAFELKSAGKADFTDMAEASDYAVESINIMYTLGLIKGSGDGRFNPLSTATRAEAAQMLYNILNR